MQPRHQAEWSLGRSAGVLSVPLSLVVEPLHPTSSVLVTAQAPGTHITTDILRHTTISMAIGRLCMAAEFGASSASVVYQASLHNIDTFDFTP